MKLPSIENLLNEASLTFKRFPFVIISSVLGALVMIYLVGTEQPSNEDGLVSIAMACLLGIPLLLAVKLYAERNGWSEGKAYLVQALFVLVLAAYALTLPDDKSDTDITRYFLFVIGVHLLVSFSPFIQKGEIKGFWAYNEVFFLRILTAVLFSGVLYAGLSIAIVSFDKLFSMDIDGDLYGQLFFLIMGVFNTWFFLSGVPENFAELDSAERYRKGLKIFTQYVLLPLVTVYLLILYLYMFKIIFEWNWPVGWVSYLVLGFSITGILSILLIYPIRNTEGNTWINTFSKGFYIALFPLIVLLFLSIMVRISDYGITEKRYFVFVLAIWLGGMALYFTFSKIKNIKVIPISLCIIALLCSFGPWGAFSVSINNQVSRLEGLLTSSNILVNGKIVKVEKQTEDIPVHEISSIVDFLSDRDALDEIQPWFDTGLDTLNDAERYTRSAVSSQRAMDLMGLEYQPYRYSETNNKFTTFHYSTREVKTLNIIGYDLLYDYNSYSYDNEVDAPTIFFAGDSIRLTRDKNTSVITLKLNGGSELHLDIKRIMDENTYSSSDLPLEKMTVENESPKMKAKFFISSLSVKKEDEKKTITGINGKLIIKIIQ